MGIRFSTVATPDIRERREPSVEQFEFAASARHIRDSLSCVENVLRSTDPGVSRRARILLGEILGCSSDRRHTGSGAIRVRLSIQPSSVLMQVAGSALLMTPDELAAGAEDFPESSLRTWMVDDLADEWGVDRRAEEPAMWFRIARP